MKKITEEEVEKLKIILNKIYDDDQRYRKISKKMLDNYGANSVEVFDAIKKQGELDKVNLERIEIILRDYGWLGEDEVGYKESEAIFLVIQHSSLEVQVKYYPIMEEAVENGKAWKCDLACLQDRILVKQGKKQIYGTQLIYNEEEGHYEVEPLVYPKRLDERRKSMGLPPMSEYLEYYGLTWEDGKTRKK